MNKVRIATLVVLGLTGLVFWAYLDKWTNKDPLAGVRVGVETTAGVVTHAAEKAAKVVEQAKDAVVDIATHTDAAQEIVRKQEEAAEAKALAAQQSQPRFDIHVTVTNSEATATAVSSQPQDTPEEQRGSSFPATGSLSSFNADKQGSK